MVDYAEVLGLCVEIVKFCIPFVLIFGFSGKMLNFAFDMMFDKKINI